MQSKKFKGEFTVFVQTNNKLRLEDINSNLNKFNITYAFPKKGIETTIDSIIIDTINSDIDHNNLQDYVIKAKQLCPFSSVIVIIKENTYLDYKNVGLNNTNFVIDQNCHQQLARKILWLSQIQRMKMEYSNREKMFVVNKQSTGSVDDFDKQYLKEVPNVALFGTPSDLMMESMYELEKHDIIYNASLSAIQLYDQLQFKLIDALIIFTDALKKTTSTVLSELKAYDNINELPIIIVSQDLKEENFVKFDIEEVIKHDAIKTIGKRTTSWIDIYRQYAMFKKLLNNQNNNIKMTNSNIKGVFSRGFFNKRLAQILVEDDCANKTTSVIKIDFKKAIRSFDYASIIQTLRTYLRIQDTIYELSDKELILINQNLSIKDISDLNAKIARNIKTLAPQISTSVITRHMKEPVSDFIKAIQDNVAVNKSIGNISA